MISIRSFPLIFFQLQTIILDYQIGILLIVRFSSISTKSYLIQRPEATRVRVVFKIRKYTYYL